MWSRLLIGAALVAAAALALGCGEHGHDDGHDHDHSAITVPSTYASLSSPHTDPAAVADQGKAIFQARCASCHGEGATGDGPQSDKLDPKPSDLSSPTFISESTDGYLFWRLTEGGVAPFDSPMPAYGELLTEDERWLVIAFLRSLN